MLVLKEIIVGAKNTKTIITSLILFIGGLFFFFIGLLSYFKEKYIFLKILKNINFLPQGFTMLFYGSFALGIFIYLFLTIFWDIGSGYNEFSKKENRIRLVRLGFPGKYRKIYFSFTLDSIEKLKFSIKQGLNPQCNIVVILKDKREIPIYPSNKFLPILEIEKKALQLAKFLNLSLETSIN